MKNIIAWCSCSYHTIRIPSIRKLFTMLFIIKRFRFFMICILLCQLSEVKTFDIEIISIIPKRPLIIPSLPWSGPALGQAVRSANFRFSDSNSRLNLTLHTLYNPADQTCDESDYSALMFLTKYYYESRRHPPRCFAIIAAGMPYSAQSSLIYLI